jgi:DNA-binding transcriptional MerR regulator
MDKSPEAFRTISEVAEALETPAHVLRFWESRFPQIRPVKRAGGRRYYRPSDIALLAGIKRLLHDEGMTIRGVQKVLREQGIRHVSGLVEETSPEEEALGAAMAGRLDQEPAETPEEAAEATAAALRAALEPQESVVVPLWPAAAPAETGMEQGVLPGLGADTPPGPVPGDLPPRDLPPDDVPPQELPGTIPEELPEPGPDLPGPPAETPEMPDEVPPAFPPEDPTPDLDPNWDEPAPPEEQAVAGPGETLAARLRALPRGGALAARAPELQALADRLTLLRARLSTPPSDR